MTSTLSPAPKSSAAISAATMEPLPFAFAVGPAISVRTPIFTLPSLSFVAAVWAKADPAENARAMQTATDQWIFELAIFSSLGRPVWACRDALPPFVLGFHLSLWNVRSANTIGG